MWNPKSIYSQIFSRIKYAFKRFILYTENCFKDNIVFIYQYYSV